MANRGQDARRMAHPRHRAELQGPQDGPVPRHPENPHDRPPGLRPRDDVQQDRGTHRHAGRLRRRMR